MFRSEGPATSAIKLDKHNVKPRVGGYKHRVVKNLTAVHVDEYYHMSRKACLS